MKRKEEKVLNASAKLWNLYLKLKAVHPDDINDVRFHIHAIQNIVMSRTERKKEMNK